MGKWADRFASLSWDSDDANSTEGRSREAPDPAAPEPDPLNGIQSIQLWWGTGSSGAGAG